MALRLIEGFGHTAFHSTLISGKWTGQGNQQAAPSTSVGRYEPGSLRIADARQGLYKQINTYENWLVVGAAFFFDLVSGNPGFLFTFRQDGTVHCCLRISNAGILQANLSTATIQAVAANPVPNATWMYIECKVRIEDSPNGRMIVRVNNVTVIDFTGDMRSGGTNGANQLLLSGIDPGFSDWQGYIDDLYLLDVSGSAPNNDFLGDVRVETLEPNGNGASSQFVGSDGNSVDNYLLVDEVTPDDNTTYVQSSVVGEKDTWAYGDLATTSGTVYGVQLNPRHAKADAGSRTAVSVARESGGTEEDSAAKFVFDSYTYYPDLRETKPSGGAWSIADVNGAQFGMKVNS